MNKIDQNLLNNGIILPEPASPVGTYVPYNISGNLLYNLKDQQFLKL